MRITKKLYDAGLIRFINAPDQNMVAQMLKSELNTLGMPNWEKFAKDSNLSELHALVYPLLSGMSHGNMLFMGERLTEDKIISSLADEKNIEQFIPIANNVFRDCFLLCREWIVHGKLHPVPDIKKLMTRK